MGLIRAHALIEKGLRRHTNALDLGAQIRAHALIEKGLRHDARRIADVGLDSSPRPDREGIKTFQRCEARTSRIRAHALIEKGLRLVPLYTCCVSPYSSPRPDREGIKTSRMNVRPVRSTIRAHALIEKGLRPRLLDHVEQCCVIRAHALIEKGLRRGQFSVLQTCHDSSPRPDREGIKTSTL